MKQNPIGAVLVGLLLVAVLGTAALSWRYIQIVRRLQAVQYQNAVYNFQRNQAQLMAAEAVEYGKKNPALEPVLQSLGLKAKPTNAAGAVAPGK